MFEMYLLITTILLLCALAFRFAGTRPLLNTMDYRSIGDAARFNRYVGARMTLPVAVAACCAGVTYWNPSLGVPLVFLIPLSVMGVVVWVGVGSKQFSADSGKLNKNMT